jgi:hypothetical protein
MGELRLKQPVDTMSIEFCEIQPNLAIGVIAGGRGSKRDPSYPGGVAGRASRHHPFFFNRDNFQNPPPVSVANIRV